MRPKRPENVIQWERSVQAAPPRCCHTCYHYNDAGECRVFDMRPPESFTVEVDQCEKWEQEVPF